MGTETLGTETLGTENLETYDPGNIGHSIHRTRVTFITARLIIFLKQHHPKCFIPHITSVLWHHICSKSWEDSFPHKPTVLVYFSLSWRLACVAKLKETLKKKKQPLFKVLTLTEVQPCVKLIKTVLACCKRVYKYKMKQYYLKQVDFIFQGLIFCTALINNIFVIYYTNLL